MFEAPGTPVYGPPKRVDPPSYTVNCRHGWTSLCCSVCFPKPAVTMPPAPPTDWTPSEPEEIIAIFSDLLKAATGDGAKKRAAGTKVSWRVDDGHRAAMYRHLRRWQEGEKVDADSGASPLVHVAWRCLALAFQGH